MVLLVAYAFYYRNVFSPTIYHHMPSGVSDTPEHSNHIYLKNSSLMTNRPSATQTPWHGCEQPAAQRRVRIAPAKQP